MTSNHNILDAAATERKARLAKLKSLKRKQPQSESEGTDTLNEDSSAPPSEPAIQYLSGRNYDPDTRGPKLGFENAPNANPETLENRAATIALEAINIQAKEDKEEKPIDLFQLQPKKPNWDLKRDVARKMEVLNARTDNAIARLVRDRIEAQKGEERGAAAVVGGGGGEENVGLGGVELVESMHTREKAEEEEFRREKEQDDELT